MNDVNNDQTIDLKPIKRVAEKAPPFLQKEQPPVVQSDQVSVKEQGQVTEIPVTQITTDQVVPLQNQPVNSPSVSQPTQPITQEVSSSQAEPVVTDLPKSETATLATDQQPETSEQQPVIKQVASATPATDKSVDVTDKQFIDKLDLDPEAQQVFDKAAQSNNPEQVFDAAETERDRQLAEKLVKESGLAPELVQKALGEKTKHIQQEQSSVPPHQVNELKKQ